MSHPSQTAPEVSEVATPPSYTPTDKSAAVHAVTPGPLQTDGPNQTGYSQQLPNQPSQTRSGYQRDVNQVLYQNAAPRSQQDLQPHQQQQQQQAFVAVWPLHSLRSVPAPVNCPNCGQNALTRNVHHSGGNTHGLAILLGVVACLCCIPYMFDGTKDVWHSCGNCGIPLATYHRSGRTDVHAFGGVEK